MDEYVRCNGYLMEVENEDHLPLEDLAKKLCEEENLKLGVCDDSYVDVLLCESCHEYIVLGGALYEIQVTEELEVEGQYCEFIPRLGGLYEFRTQFYEGDGTHIIEVLEKGWENYDQ